MTSVLATMNPEGDEQFLNLMCNITRDCMVANGGTFYVWALLTTIFRLIKTHTSYKEILSNHYQLEVHHDQILRPRFGSTREDIQLV